MVCKHCYKALKIKLRGESKPSAIDIIDEDLDSHLEYEPWIHCHHFNKKLRGWPEDRKEKE